MPAKATKKNEPREKEPGNNVVRNILWTLLIFNVVLAVLLIIIFIFVIIIWGNTDNIKCSQTSMLKNTEYGISTMSTINSDFVIPPKTPLNGIELTCSEECKSRFSDINDSDPSLIIKEGYQNFMLCFRECIALYIVNTKTIEFDPT